MPTIDFDGRALHLDGLDRPVDDTSVAVTLHELRTLMDLLPEGDALPVASRGDLMVLMPGSHTLPYVVALARMRPAVDAPRYPAVSAETPVDGAQMAQEPVPAPGGDPRLDDLAESLQQRMEQFLANLGVDPHRYDHQNMAGEIVSATLGILRNHGYLPEPMEVHPDVRAAVARGVGSVPGLGLEAASAAARAVVRELGQVLGR